MTNITQSRHRVLEYLPQKFLWCILLILPLFASSLCFGQVQIKLKQPPMNQLGVKDMWNVTVRNTSSKDVQLTLRGTADEAQDGRLVDGKTGMFTLKANETRTMSGSNIPGGGTYSWKNKKFQEAILRSGNAPSGNYTICVYAESESGSPLGQDCFQQNIALMSPPTLISPADRENIPDDQTPLFTWLPPTPAPKDAMYNIRVVEVIGNQSATDAIAKNSAVFEQKEVRSTSMQYPISARKLDVGKKYAWQVSSGELKSEVWVFASKSTNRNNNIVKGDDVSKNNINDDVVNKNVEKKLVKDPDTETSSGVPTRNIFTGSIPFSQEKCVILTSPKPNARIKKVNELVFQWRYPSIVVSKQPSYLVIEKEGNLKNKEREIFLRKEVTGLTSFKPEKEIAEQILNTGGNYQWSIQTGSRVSCASQMFTTSASCGDIEIKEIKTSCSQGNMIHVCIIFKYTNSQNKPMTIAQSGSGLKAKVLPTLILIPISNIRDQQNNAVNVSTFSVAAGSTSTLCFDIGSTVASSIKLILQGDDFDPDPDVVCQPGISEVISNPCICNKCDSSSIKIVLPPGNANVDPKTGQLGITQNVFVSPDQLLSMSTEIAYVHWEPTNEKCIPCNKNPKEWGTLLQASFKGQKGTTTQNRSQWKFESPSNTTSGKTELTIGLPQMLDCCKLKGYICIRYKFFMQPGDTPSECYECERVVCYSF